MGRRRWLLSLNFKKENAMSNVVSIFDAPRKPATKKNQDFKKNMERNARRQEELAKERLAANHRVTREYKLHKKKD